MSGELEGGPKPLKKSSGVPRVINPSTDPLVQTETRSEEKPVKTTRSSIAPGITTMPARPRVIAPSITKITPARAPQKPNKLEKPVIDSVLNTESKAPAPEPAPEPTTEILTISDAVDDLIADTKEEKIEDDKNPVDVDEHEITEEITEESIEESVPDTPETTATTEPAMTVEPAKKPKKKKIILFFVISCIIIVLGALATFLTITFLNTDNRVSAATIKLLSNESPRYIQFEGKIESTIEKNGTKNTIISAIDNKTDLETDAWQINSHNIIKTNNSNDVDYNFVAIRDGRGDYYFSLDNIKNIVAKAPENERTVDGTLAIVGADTNLVSIDGDIDKTKLNNTIDQTLSDKWLQISSLDTDEDILETPFGGNQLIECWADTLLNLPKLGTNAKSLYEKNPFISYSTDKPKIDQKTNTLYHLSFNDEKMANFINSVTSFGSVNIFRCMDVAVNNDVTTSDVTKVLPTNLDVYVEINENNDFTRLYFEYTNTPAGTLIKADLNITYLSEFSIKIPTQTIDFVNFQSAITETMQPEEEPTEPEETIPEYQYAEDDEEEDEGDDNNTPPSYYDDPAQDVDINNSNSSFDPGF